MRPDIVIKLPDRCRLLIEVTVFSGNQLEKRQRSTTFSAVRGPHPHVVVFAIAVTGAVADDVLLSVRNLETAGLSTLLDQREATLSH